MYAFCVENHEVVGPLTQNCLHLDKEKSIVSTFSVFVVLKHAVITTQKSSYVECFSFVQQRFVLAHPFPDISIKSTKLHFQRQRKNSSNDFALFLQNDF